MELLLLIGFLLLIVGAGVCFLESLAGDGSANKHAYTLMIIGVILILIFGVFH